MLSTSLFFASLMALLFGSVFLWLALKSEQKWKYVLFPIVFYFLGISFLIFTVGVGYSFTSPAECKFYVNETHEVNATGHGQGSHTDVEYTYQDLCKENYDLTAIEQIYVLLLWSFYFVILGAFMTLVYLVYNWVKNIW